ncbi:protein RIC-3b [Pungitius pungitius]|uniref:protein RIC-3b n=1 Tax=Pungitius pungitius TaxID=134920 RepID=UPI002E0ED825
MRSDLLRIAPRVDSPSARTGPHFKPVAMAMSTFQKVTLATCLVLCVGLLLPKMLLSGGRKDAAEGSGRFPSMMQRQAAPEARGQRAAGARAKGPEAPARAKGGGAGAGTGGKSNLAGQIIPVYGFGILLYILYILFKITSKGNSKPSESRFPSVRSENKKRKISDFELVQLQDKLRETELVMENIVSNVNHSPDRVKGVTADQEESLLQQLTEITRAMHEGKLVEDMAPEKKNQEDWEEAADYPEEPQQAWEHPPCCCHHGPQAQPDRTPADGAAPEDGGGDAADGADLQDGGGGGGGDAADGADPEGGGGGGDAADGADPEDGGGDAADGADPEDGGGGDAADGADPEDGGGGGGDAADGADPEDGGGGGGDAADGADPEDGGGGGGDAADGAEDPSKERDSLEAGPERAGEELELTLKMTCVTEQEEATETEASSCGAVRRRNKRRRAKKASH